MSQTLPRPSGEPFWHALSSRGAAAGAAVLLLVVFLKNAWVDEDAYITFRVVEQLFEGNGLRWNAHERVQAYTHPLWLGLLAMARVITRDLFLAAIVVSLLCCAIAVVGLHRTLRDPLRWLAALALVLASRSIFDFTTSGLEQPLSFALLALYMVVYLDRRPGVSSPEAGARWLGALTLVFALLLLSRHDLATLVLAPQLEALHHARRAGAARLARSIGVGALPFIAWTGFSLFYYGLPVPNTALAKLNNGIARPRLRGFGLDFLRTTSIEDPVVPIAIAGACVAAGLALARRDPRARALAACVLGAALNLFYLVQIGGGHMLGRFVASATFVSIVVACAALPRPRALLGASFALLAVWTIVQPSAPLRTGPGFAPPERQVAQVLDEREIFFPSASLWQWARRDPAKPFPVHRWTDDGVRLREQGPSVVRRGNVGFTGFHAGPDVVIVDPLALTDPLLSRLPSRKIFRIGHFPRALPDGYLETLRTGSPGFTSPAMQAYYDRIALVTQGDLLDPRRLAEIPRLLIDGEAPTRD